MLNINDYYVSTNKFSWKDPFFAVWCILGVAWVLFRIITLPLWYLITLCDCCER